MGDTIESGKKSSSNKEMDSLSLQTDRLPRDLLQKFKVGARRSASVPGRIKLENLDDDGSGDIELNLGLSLGGRFGVDKSKLVRSSSIASTLPVIRDDDALTPAPAVGYDSLVRTSSLPVETEEEWRKRKELQSLRRMAAKRRRSEKQGRGVVVRSDKDERSEREREEYVASMIRVGSSTGPPSGLPYWAGGGGRQGGGGSSGGSVESQGGSGSSLSEMDSKPAQGSNCGGEASSASIQSLRERTGQDATGSSGAKVRESASRTPGAEMENPSKNRGKEIGVNSVEDMPCVFTKGDGPNGRRIEGILYKYGKGEEVRIMCVCHGSFLSPAEFVKHAGGTDVDHPLKHIVVNHNPTSFL